MERVKNIYEVAHLWANRNSGGAKSSNLFFEQEDIYSYGYHFLIARHVYNDHGEHAVLFTRRTYSKTTAAHLRIVKQASAHLDLLYVPDPELPKEEIFEKWYSEIKDIANSLNNACKPQNTFWIFKG